MHARRGNIAGATGQAAKAVLEEAHAIACERGQWVCNEKRLIETAGLAGLHAWFAGAPTDPARLGEWVDGVAGALGVPGGEIAPWR
jgi:hypothetical protein